MLEPQPSGNQSSSSPQNQDRWPHNIVSQLKEIQQGIIAKKRHHLNHLHSQITLAKTKINSRTREMTRELFDIYTVNEFPDRRGYSICDIYLPSSQHLEGHDATMISVAVGYVGHLLVILSEILGIVLRFPVTYQGSKSSIYCNRRNQSFPLHIDSTKGRDWNNFAYGMTLLNLDVLQIRTLYGLTTDDPEDTLANINELKIMLSRDE